MWAETTIKLPNIRTVLVWGQEHSNDRALESCTSASTTRPDNQVLAGLSCRMGTLPIPTSVQRVTYGIVDSRGKAGKILIGSSILFSSGLREQRNIKLNSLLLLMRMTAWGVEVFKERGVWGNLLEQIKWFMWEQGLLPPQVANIIHWQDCIKGWNRRWYLGHLFSLQTLFVFIF